MKSLKADLSFRTGLVLAPVIIFSVVVEAWNPMTSGTTGPLFAVWGSSGSEVFAAGGNGTILHYPPVSAEFRAMLPRREAVALGRSIRCRSESTPSGRAKPPRSPPSNAQNGEK
jgi:hypothetical protein